MGRGVMTDFNSKGSYRTTRENMMKAFDKLPREVRMALCEAPENWVPQPLLTKIRRGRRADDVAFMVRTWSRNFIEKSNRKRGIDIPAPPIVGR